MDSMKVNSTAAISCSTQSLPFDRLLTSEPHAPTLSSSSSVDFRRRLFRFLRFFPPSRYLDTRKTASFFSFVNACCFCFFVFSNGRNPAFVGGCISCKKINENVKQTQECLGFGRYRRSPAPRTAVPEIDRVCHSVPLPC